MKKFRFEIKNVLEYDSELRERSERTVMEYYKDITGVHLYSDGLEFPVAVYERSSWDRTQISYLDTSRHTTESLIDWCKNHQIDWEILYPLKKLSPFRHPIRHLHYLKLMRNL